MDKTNHNETRDVGGDKASATRSSSVSTRVPMIDGGGCSTMRDGGRVGSGTRWRTHWKVFPCLDKRG